MPDGLYERDAFAWAEQQATLLSRLAAGERLNGDVDWEHVIEEVRDVGLSELHRCESLLTRAMTHLLKIHMWPDSQAVAHWRGEIASLLVGAQRNFTPSMRQRIDMADLYANALYAARVEAGTAGEKLPEACPFTQNDLLAHQPDIAKLLSKIEP